MVCKVNLNCGFIFCVFLFCGLFGMEALLKEYDMVVLYHHLQSGTLHTFLGINHRRARTIADYICRQRKSQPVCDTTRESFVCTALSSARKTYLQWWGTLKGCSKALHKDIVQYWQMCEEDEMDVDMEITPQSIMQNPMVLLTTPTKSVWTWKTVDKLAIANGWWTKTSDQRVDVYVEQILLEVCKKEGHTYLTLERFVAEWRRYQDSTPELSTDFIPHLHRLVNRHRVRVLTEDKTCKIQRLAPEEFYQQESAIVDGIQRLLSIPSESHPTHQYTFKDFDCLTLTQEQLTAINGILNAPFAVLTGSGGTGKTSCVVKLAIAKIRQHHDRYLLLSPTHAAKKNAHEEIDAGQPNCQSCYQTVQSSTYLLGDACKLEICIQQLQKSKPPKLLHVFVEECSMVDRQHFAKLFSICSAHNKNVRLTLLGDVNQLPAIGAGQIFSDIVQCSAISTFTLTQQFRSQHSDIQPFCEMILGNSVHHTRWNIGTVKNTPFRDVSNHFSSDIQHATIESVLATYRDQGFVATGVSQAIDTKGTIQIITNRNATCEVLVPIVRRVFSKQLGHATVEAIPSGCYAVSDPVLLRTNTSLFKNGDTATIIEIMSVDTFSTRYTLRLVESENNTKNVSKSEAQYFQYRVIDGYAYVSVLDKHIKPILARTVHSTQGLGFDIVLYVLDHDFPIDLNMHYTAYSRAKQKLHLFGSREYFNGRRARTPVRTKNSFVAQWLAENKSNSFCGVHQ